MDCKLLVTAALGISLLAACKHPSNPAVRQLPPQESGYYGQPGSFHIQVDTGGAATWKGWTDADDRMYVNYESSKGSIQEEWVEQTQRSVVVLPVAVDSLMGVLLFHLQSFVGKDGVPSTHTTFEFENIGGRPPASIPLDRYLLCRYCQDYYGRMPPLTPDSPRLQPWTLQNGTALKDALIGPDTNHAYSQVGSYTIRASQVGYARNIGWLGATVTFSRASGFSKTLTLRRVLPLN